MPRVTPARKPKPPSELANALKTAFMYRWNLLAFLGGVAGSFVSGHPDIFLPFVGALEMAYLGSMASFPKFRKAVAREGYQSPNFAAEPKKDPSLQLAAMVTSLPPESRKRFDLLRARCLEMREIAHGVRGKTGTGSDSHEELRAPALDRLLWVFLRLLQSQNALRRFLEATSEGALEKKTVELKARLETARAEGDERMLRSLTDLVAVAELRLENYRKAEANAEFVEVELDRIEAKVQTLTEMAVNRQDPDFLSSQVDAAADSMTVAEGAITELQTITGMVDDLEEPPPILETSLQSRGLDVA